MDQNICLCYSEGKGVYTDDSFDCKDSIFVTYNQKGFKTTNLEIPSENIKIQIKSNFKYCGSSYLYAVIERDGKTLLDFSEKKVNVLNHCSVTEFAVSTEDWKSLLKNIARACSTTREILDIQKAIRYVSQLGHMLNQDSIAIKGAYHDKKTTLWKGDFLVTLFVCDKLRDIIEGLKRAHIDNEILSDHILTICRECIQKIKSMAVGANDKRSIRFAQTLVSIGDYMLTHNAGIEFLQNFQTSGLNK